MKGRFHLKNGDKKEFAANAGQTLMDVAKHYDLDMEGACGGAMACSTCHVIVDPAWYKKNCRRPVMTRPNMLDLAPASPEPHVWPAK